MRGQAAHGVDRRHRVRARRLEALNSADPSGKFRGRLDMARVESLGTRLAERSDAILPRRLQVQGRDRSRRRSPGQRRSGRDAQAVHVPPERPQPGSRPGEPAIRADIRSIFDRLPRDKRLYVVISGANHFTFSDDGAVLKSTCCGESFGYSASSISTAGDSCHYGLLSAHLFSTRTSREQVFASQDLIAAVPRDKSPRRLVGPDRKVIRERRPRVRAPSYASAASRRTISSSDKSGRSSAEPGETLPRPSLVREDPLAEGSAALANDVVAIALDQQELVIPRRAGKPADLSTWRSVTEGVHGGLPPTHRRAGRSAFTTVTDDRSAVGDRTKSSITGEADELIPLAAHPTEAREERPAMDATSPAGRPFEQRPALVDHEETAVRAAGSYAPRTRIS